MNLFQSLVKAAIENTNTVLSVRTAILMNGLGLDPNDGHALLKAAVACSKNIDPLTPAFESNDWHLYVAVTDLDCPIHCIMMAPWLVDAVMQVTGQEDYPFERLDPDCWLSGIANVWSSMPAVVHTEQANDLLQELLDSRDRLDPSVLPRLREMLKAKGEAIANGHSHAVKEGHNVHRGLH